MSDHERRHDADWLRVFATYLLFLFHVAKVFDVAPFYHVKNDQLISQLDLFTHFVHLWHMPLLFALAGWSLCASLRKRGTDGIVQERMRRLFVPLLFGIVAICPVIKYYELRSGMNLSIAGLETGVDFNEPFLAYWPSFFFGLDRFTWAHLWFVAYLLTFTLLYRKRCVTRLSAPPSQQEPRTRDLYAPLVWLVLIQTTLRLVWPGSLNLVWDWANFAYYSVYFLLGFEVGRDPRWEPLIRAEWRRAGGMAMAASVAMAAYLIVVFDGSLPLGQTPISLTFVASLLPLLAVTAVAGFGMVVALTGFAMRHLGRGSRALAYLSESSLPVYVLHQVAIVVPAFYVVGLDLAVASKFALVLAISITATLGVYHCAVRPFSPMRFALGMSARAAALTRVRRASTVAALGTIVLAFGLVSNARANTEQVVGLWWADSGSAQVEIRARGEELVGTIVWLRAPFGEDGRALRDINHPDPERHKRTVVGIEMLSGFREEEDNPGTWNGGRVYDPGNGRTYQGTIRLDGNDRLLLRGFIGISLLGRTTTWVRVGREEISPVSPLPAPRGGDAS